MMAVYVGTAVVRARPMKCGEYNKLRGWDMPLGEDPEEAGYLLEHVDGAPNVPGFDGYVTWRRADVFEQTHPASGAMGFSQALELLRRGFAIARTGWNGKGMFAYLVPAASYPAQTGVARAYFDEKLVPYNAYMALKGVDGRVSCWTPSMGDVLADDWAVLEVPDLFEMAASSDRPGQLVPAKLVDGQLTPTDTTPGMGY